MALIFFVLTYKRVVPLRLVIVKRSRSAVRSTKIGEVSWKEIKQRFIEDVKYGQYIDKTCDLEQFENPGIYRICAPSGYGKTTLLTTIGCFYGTELDDGLANFGKTDQEFLDCLFGLKAARKLKIAQDTNNNFSHKFGNYVTIFFQFPTVCENYHDGFKTQVNQLIAELKPTLEYAGKRIEAIRNLNDREKLLKHMDKFKMIINEPMTSNVSFEVLYFCFKTLCRYLQCLYDRKVILLLDNTEQPYFTAWQDPNQKINNEQYIELFAKLGDSSSVHSVVFSSTSVYVNASFCTVNAMTYDVQWNRLHSFGFTVSEVEQLCNHFNQSKKRRRLLQNDNYIQNDCLKLYECKCIIETLNNYQYSPLIKHSHLFKKIKKY